MKVLSIVGICLVAAGIALRFVNRAAAVALIGAGPLLTILATVYTIEPNDEDGLVERLSRR